MAYTAWHDFTAGETLTASLLDAIVNNLKALYPVGMYGYMCRAATTAETLVEGVWLECNAVSVLRTSYPDLNTLWSGLGYPFGFADATHMYLPDAQGRSIVSMSSGGHADVNALGDSDAVTKANRTPKHNSTNGLSGSGGSLSGSPALTGAPGVGTLAISGGQVSYPVQDMQPGSVVALRQDTGQSGSQAASLTGASITGTPSIGTLAVNAGTLSVSGISITGTIGPGGTRPIDTGTYLVGGTLFIKAVA